MEHLKKISQILEKHPLELIFRRKICEGGFKYLSLNCTKKTDVCKMDLTDRYLHTTLNPFLVGLWDSFQVRECKIAPQLITLDRDMLQPQKMAHR